ncbi:PglL family O-oligosaccharyltransferase [Leptothrix discophora]|uniref:Wzy polymerase domain-containing protein n=1 Tax=Leptothrix discophora TaxID=89 RepID=A0ABT9G749_LEPDI|nr:O-antigen ligase family protein [Leptothrix discophora]MDP4302216.1 Wzy polymerase domain-containing protein [Leptothrix discophora]
MSSLPPRHVAPEPLLPLLAGVVALPFLFAPSYTPTTTFVNQWLSFAGLALVLLTWRLAWRPGTSDHVVSLATRGQGSDALRVLLALMLVLAAGQAWTTAPFGQRLIPIATLLLATVLAWVAGRCARAWPGSAPASADGEPAGDLWWHGLLIGLLVAGLLSVAVSVVQVFLPEWADGRWFAASTTPGRAIGNMRQPNQLSTLLLWACGATVWLSRRHGWRWPLPAALLALLVGAEVLNASRTGMVGVGLLALWGLVDRRLPRGLRVAMAATVAVYAAGWWSMEHWSSLTGQTFFGDDQVRKTLHGDPSSSRGKIWSNTLELIAQHPWTGVGAGAFNFVWSMTPFAVRPIAFFDHTHNLVLELAVDFGLPYTVLVLGLMALFAWRLRGVLTQADELRAQAARCAAFLLVLVLVHSLLEYPLWYVYFLLPAALIAGWLAGLARREDVRPASLDVPAAATLPVRSARLLLLLVSAAALLASFVAARQYHDVAVIFDPDLVPGGRPGPLSERIAQGQRSVLFGHHADYARLTMAQRPELVFDDFERPLFHLLDTRLMIAYARALHARGDTARARHVAARLREFRNPASAAFFAPCNGSAVAGAAAVDPDALPFQCGPDPALPANDLRP